MPSSKVKKIYDEIDGAKPYYAQDGLYTFPCASVPDLSFGWGGSNYMIGSKWAVRADELVIFTRSK